MKALAILPLIFTSSLASEVALELTILANSGTNLSYRVGTQLTGTHFPASFQDRFQASIDYSGNILAQATVNSNDGSFETIEFTGGEIVSQDATGILAINVGTIPYTITFATRGITRTTSSSQVDVLPSGFVNGDLHFTTLTDGSVEVSNFRVSSPNPTVKETFNFPTNENDLIANESLFPTGTGATTISSSLVSNGLFGSNYSVQLNCIVSVPLLSPNATIQAAGLGPQQQFQQQYFEIGNLTATGTFSIPNAFGQWAADNELELVTGQEKNTYGFPYALLFAFDLPATTSSLPVEFGKVSPATARITPPAGGLGFDLVVEYSPDLATDFEPLDPALIDGGASQLLQGKTQPIDISFPPSASQGFLRFSAEQ